MLELIEYKCTISFNNNPLYFFKFPLNPIVLKTEALR